MRRALLFCAAIAFAIACGDNITEPRPTRAVTPPVSLATTTSGDGLSITTDKDDYAPGDTVHFTGTGWQAGDSLDIVLVDDALTQETHAWAVGIADDGTFHDSTYVVDVADLGVTFTLTASSRATGRSLTVTFTDGNVKVEGSPTGVRFTLTGATYSNNTCTLDENIRQATAENSTFSFGTGNSNFLKLTVSTTSASGGNFLSWTLPGGGTSTANPLCVANPSGNATYTANYQAKPDLKITKTAGSASFTVGSASSYTLKVDNVGQAATSAAVTVTDEIPAGLTVGTITASGWTCTGTNSLSCNRSDALAAGSSYSNIVVAVTPTVSAGSSVTNTALVSGGGDVSAGNNGSTITTPVNAFVDLTIDKSHTGDFTRGTNGIYTLTVTNAGFAVTSGDITVTDLLPNGLTFVSGTGTDWTCTAAMGGKTVTCTRLAANTIGIGATAPPITLTVAVANNTNASVTNTASLSGGGEPAANAGNNSDDDATTVVDPVAGPTKLAFTTAAFSRVINVCSPTITVQTQNASSAPTNPTANTTVNLTSSSLGGTFYSNNTCTTGITSVVIQTTGNTASFFYKDANVGTPTLTAAATGLTSATQQETITAAPNAAPTVDAGGPYSGAEGSAIALSPTVTDPDVGDVLTYKWTVNTSGIDAGGTCAFDDDTKKDANVTCTDDSNGGKFTLTLTVDDGKGHVVPDNADLTVTNATPTANAGGPYTGAEGSAIQLGGSGDDPGNNDDAGLTYKWTINTSGIDAGGTCAFDDDTKKDAQVTCTDDSGAGHFTLSLVVKDDDAGTSAASTADLTVTNAKPVADAGGPYTGDEGSAIQLSGSADDPGNNDDAGLTYKWTVNTAGIDAGGTCTFDNDTKKDAKVTCTDDSGGATGGHFTLSLVATDDDGGVSLASTANLTVNNVDPVADAGGGANGYSGNEGSAIQLHGSATDVGSNDTFTWAWIYTAGPGALDPGASCSFSSATAKEPTITCTDDGTVKLTLTVTDDNGGSDTDDATLTLANVDPVAEAGGGATSTYSGNEGSAIQLHGSATDVGTNDTFTWGWVYTAGPGFINGATCGFDDATAQEPKITCNDNGTVKLTLTVTDDDGGSDTDDATLTLANVDPVADAGGGASGYLGNEGSAISLTGSKSDAGSNDTHTYLWTYAVVSGVDVGATCSFSSTTVLNPTITCTDDGVFKVSLKVTDDDDGTDTDDATLTVANVNPVATAGGPYSGNEGAAIQLSGSGDDPGNNDDAGLTYLWTVNTGLCTFDDATNKNGKVTCTDNGSFTLTLAVSDDDGGTGTNTASLTVANVAPTVTILAPADYSVWNINGFAGVLNFVNASFTDVGKSDTHTCSINWGDGDPEVAGVVSETANSGLGTCTLTPLSNPYPDDGAGIYTLTVTVRDDDGGEGSASRTLIVYDPSAGFVTGGGWINSPAGACYLATCNATTTGRANFGFVSKYLKATSTVPSGNTEFQFQAGNLNFHSEVYELLLVNQSGTNAQYKGSGTINGVGGYKFMLWAADGSYDTFRIKIWQEVGGSEAVAYDNMGTGGGGYSTVPIAGGSIVIHVNGKVASK